MRWLDKLLSADDNTASTAFVCLACFVVIIMFIVVLAIGGGK